MCLGKNMLERGGRRFVGREELTYLLAYNAAEQNLCASKFLLSTLLFDIWFYDIPKVYRYVKTVFKLSDDIIFKAKLSKQF